MYLMSPVLSSPSVKSVQCLCFGKEVRVFGSRCNLNGKPIGGKKGYPKNRLVIPGAWGFKWIAWIVRIEAVDYDFEASYGEMEEPVDIPLGSTVPNRSVISASSSSVFYNVYPLKVSSSTRFSRKNVGRWRLS